MPNEKWIIARQNSHLVLKRFKKPCASIKRITFGHYSRLFIYIKLSCAKIIMQIRPFGQAQPLGQV